MHRRFLFPLAAAIAGLVGISPVVAAESSKAPEKGSAPTKATTSTTSDSGDSTEPADEAAAEDNNKNGSSGDSSSDPDPGPDSGSDPGPEPGSGSGSGGGQRSSSVCDPPEINKGPAPQMGDAPQTHDAGEAGRVDVERLSDTELRIAGASANDGWTEQVATASGPRVTVKFTRQGRSPSLIRFAATMDQRGTMIHTRVTSCG